MKNIVFLAPPAAGKGTISEMLIDKYHYGHISTGDLLREEIAKKSEVGLQAEKIMQEGRLVPDEIIVNMIKNKINEPSCDHGYILDGFPRNIEQAKKYEEMLKETGKDLGVVIYIDIDKEKAMKRACGRQSCASCGKIYNKYTDMKSKQDGICDVCGGKLISRSDDNEESFNKRFDEYINKTMPLYDYYKSQGVLETIMADDDKNKSFEDVKKIIEK